MSVHSLGVSEQVLRVVATRVATEFVALARELPDDKFTQSLCPSHERSAALEQRAA